MYGVYIYISYIVYPEGDRDRGGGGFFVQCFCFRGHRAEREPDDTTCLHPPTPRGSGPLASPSCCYSHNTTIPFPRKNQQDDIISPPLKNVAIYLKPDNASICASVASGLRRVSSIVCAKPRLRGEVMSGA